MEYQGPDYVIVDVWTDGTIEPFTDDQSGEKGGSKTSPTNEKNDIV